ncbi:MAG TPA: ABC transporter ATP-binding protein [Leptolyngbyaceae cyanobacterium M65_K2018_010]|nr:ABC transporter ATP-binding protein [Leptolyngbyaceae cyanobacterium M65_K2018_010]
MHRTSAGAVAAGDTEPVIAVQGLRKTYGSTLAVDGIDLVVYPGEVVGLIGPDGAGKTTTFHILAGVMEASAGEVRVLGQWPRHARLQTGYLTQQFSLYLDLSLEENLRYTAGLRRVPTARYEERRDRYLALMGLAPFKARLAGQLSGGMKQKLALCCALVSQPQILLLDEPTTGVDPVSRREFWDVLATLAATEGTTIVVATPYLDEAERCDRIALMYRGQIHQIGTIQELRDSLGLHRLEAHLASVQDLDRAAATLLSQNPPNQPPTIADVQTFGDRLDVLVSEVEGGIAELRSRLAAQAIPLTSLEVLPPTLENVFVTRLRQHTSDPPFIPFPTPRVPRPMPPLAIAATHLGKTFGDFQAVQGVNLEIRYGEIYGLLGANGAGKTTVIKMLCGLLAPTSGTMALAGQTENLRGAAIRQRLGYMSQKFTLYDDLTIRQNLEFYCGVYGIPRSQRGDRIAWVLTTCGLADQDQLITGRLPQGWKQRVAFGASVMHEPEILFLDEPTSGVDPLARRQFWRLIEDLARRGTAILVTTHYLEEAEHCNRMGFMVAGELVAQGSPRDIKASQPGQLVELVVDPIPAAAAYLKGVMAPWRVSVFGDRLHVVVDHPELALPRLQSQLQAAGLQLRSLRPIPFTLEDAFIGLVQRQETGP